MHGAAPAVGFMISVHMPPGLRSGLNTGEGKAQGHLSRTTSWASGQEHSQKVNRPGKADRPCPPVTTPALHGAEVCRTVPRLTTSSWLRRISRSPRPGSARQHWAGR